MARNAQLESGQKKEANIRLILEKFNIEQGYRLYSPIWGDCTFEKIDNNLIVVKSKGETMCFDSYGHYNPYGTECLLFPSETNRDWGDFEESLQENRINRIDAIVKKAVKHKFGYNHIEGRTDATLGTAHWADGYKQALLDIMSKSVNL